VSDDKVVEIGATIRHTPEQVLAIAGRKKWTHLLVMGYVEGSEDLVILPSNMTREASVFALEFAKLNAMGIIE
jgi:hypothetical protein